MAKRVLLGALALLIFSVGSASAQVICPLSGNSSSKLVCLLPQVYGPWGLNGSTNSVPSDLLTNGHQGHFRMLSSQVSAQLMMPLASKFRNCPSLHLRPV